MCFDYFKISNNFEKKKHTHTCLFGNAGNPSGTHFKKKSPSLASLRRMLWRIIDFVNKARCLYIFSKLYNSDVH